MLTKLVSITLVAAVLATALFLGVTSLSGPNVASADGAEVINKPDGVGCTVFVSGNIYHGVATVVQTPSGNVNLSCDVTLVAGPGVTRGTVTQDLPGPFGTLCKVTETPSGNASASCHN